MATVKEINALRASRVNSGLDPYTGTKAGDETSKQAEAARSGGASGITQMGLTAPTGVTLASATPVVTPSSLTTPGQVTIPTPSNPGVGGTNAMTGIAAQLALLQQQLTDAQSAGYASTDQIQTDPKTGNIMPKAGSDAAGRQNLDKLMNATADQPNLESIYKQERSASGIDSKQSLVNQYSNQLNTITAKAQADKLSLIGQGRGVTEAIIGGQQAQIDREAAIQALPVSMQLSAAQGDLAMAQSHLDTFFKLKSEDANKAYDYKVKMAEALYNYADKKDQRALDAKGKLDDRAFTIQQNNLNYAQTLSNTALTNGQSGVSSAILKLDSSSPTYAADLAKIAGTIQPNALDVEYKRLQIQNIRSQIAERAADTSLKLNQLPGPVQTRVQTIAGQFDTEQAVKNYQVSAEALDAMKNAGTSPTDDQSRIYAFAKVMDPNSVVRESEYKTVQDYSQSLVERIGFKAKRVFDNSGFLTTEARQFMQTTLENRIASSEKAVNNIYNEYGRRIDKVTGRTDGIEYLTDYSKAFKVPVNITENNQVVVDDVAAENVFDSVIAPKSSSWLVNTWNSLFK